MFSQKITWLYVLFIIANNKFLQIIDCNRQGPSKHVKNVETYYGPLGEKTESVMCAGVL